MPCAVARFNNGEADKAIADLDEAVRVDPNASRAYRNRGCYWFLR